MRSSQFPILSRLNYEISDNEVPAESSENNNDNTESSQSGDITEEPVESTPEETTESTPEETPEETSKETSEESTEETPEESTEATPEETPEETSEATPEEDASKPEPTPEQIVIKEVIKETSVASESVQQDDSFISTEDYRVTSILLISVVIGVLLGAVLINFLHNRGK